MFLFRGIPVFSTVIATARIDKIDGRKIFLTSEIKSIDGSILYGDATALYIKTDLWKKSIL